LIPFMVRYRTITVLFGLRQNQFWFILRALSDNQQLGGLAA